MTNELEPCPFCPDGGEPNLYGFSVIEEYHVVCDRCGAVGKDCDTIDEAIDFWNTRYKRTCHYLPDSIQTAFDEDDNEIDTGEAYSDGCDYSCDQCGCTMLGGEVGWFEETEGKYGGWNYKPRFKFCPYCGAEVVDGD